MAPKVLVICGPTATGKTALAVELALGHNGEIVSADSMQIYRGMDIGTAKPTPAERRGVPHHMLDMTDPVNDYSAARYVADATVCVDDILARGKLPIIAGGTGLYIDALLAGLTFAPFTGGHRAALRARVQTGGMAPLYAELQRLDPERAARLHPADEKRVLRALEVFYETGETITAHDARTKTIPPRYDALRLGLAYQNRADLWDAIDRRVDRMMEMGLVDEVRALLSRGVPETATALQAIGYKELLPALRGGGVAQAGEEIKLRSRQYAKRQLTWFRREQSTRWIYWEKSPNLQDARQVATAYMEEFGIR